MTSGFETPATLEARFADGSPAGTGEARRAYVRLAGEGYDAMLAYIVVYGMAEGFSRMAGRPDGAPDRFHDGLGPDAGADLPDGLDAEALVEAAREAMDEETTFEDMDVDAIERTALTLGAGLYMQVHAMAPGTAPA